VLKIKAIIRFHEKQILNPVEKMQFNLLQGFGAYTRTIAKNSMIDMYVRGDKKKERSRNRKLKKAGFLGAMNSNAVSKPGNPAFSKLGQIKKFIFFVSDIKEKNVVIGPEKLYGMEHTNTVEILEYGGTAQIFVGWPKRVSKTANYRPRPTMHLAFEKAMKKKLPGLIRGGVMRHYHGS